MFEKIKAWIKRKRETAREQQAADRLIKHIEQALGFELYEWQRLYIITGIWQPPEGRLHGRTTAYILRLLLDQSTVYYCDEAAVGMKFVAGDVSGTVQGVTHIQTDEAAATGEAGNDRTALTLSKAVKAGCKVIALERTDTVAGMTTDDIAALKGVLKQYE